MLEDPESGIPFYVGKGQHPRHAAHLARAPVPVGEATEEHRRKDAKIKEVLARGLELEAWILQHGLRPAEYLAVEAASMCFPLRSLREGEAHLPLGCRQ
jgi:hypothetical protein